MPGSEPIGQQQPEQGNTNRAKPELVVDPVINNAELDKQITPEAAPIPTNVPAEVAPSVDKVPAAGLQPTNEVTLQQGAQNPANSMAAQREGLEQPITPAATVGTNVNPVETTEKKGKRIVALFKSLLPKHKSDTPLVTTGHLPKGGGQEPIFNSRRDNLKSREDRGDIRVSSTQRYTVGAGPLEQSPQSPSPIPEQGPGASPEETQQNRAA